MVAMLLMTPNVNNAELVRDASFDVQRMALYNLERAQTTLDALRDKDIWVPEDTASFDCMHYLGNSAVDACAEALQLRPQDRVLDIGSGFNATGRYLNRHYGASITGVELQPHIHAMGRTITQHTGQAAAVHSINTNFINAPVDVIANASADHVVSFLCILHIPERAQLFERAARTLHAGGRVYIEDFYARHPLPDADAQALRDIVSCPYLPSQARYEQDLRDAGFDDVKFEDVSTPWTSFVGTRVAQYHASAERDCSLDTFYSTIAKLFADGNVGGARISARLA